MPPSLAAEGVRILAYLSRDEQVDVSVSTGEKATRRIELTLHKPWFAIYARIKPTLVIEGRGQPAQWGLGTWQLPADQTVVVGVFLFNRMWRFGQAEFALEPDHPPSLVYRAPALPFLRGRIRLHTNADRST